VLSSSEFRLHLGSTDTVSLTSKVVPGLLNEFHTFLRHVVSEAVDELGVADRVVLVQVKVIEDSAQLLGGQENAKLVQELVEFLSVKSSVFVPVMSS